MIARCLDEKNAKDSAAVSLAAYEKSWYSDNPDWQGQSATAQSANPTGSNEGPQGPGGPSRGPESQPQASPSASETGFQPPAITGSNSGRSHSFAASTITNQGYQPSAAAPTNAPPASYHSGPPA